MFTKQNSLYVFAVSINVLITYLMLLYRQPFNVDGILYMQAAQAYMQQGLHAALHVYPWPFYSILLAKISQCLHISLLYAGYLLNAIFSSILICFFLALISVCGGTLTHQYIGLAVILLEPFLNHERINIMRDLGYYAFFLCSLWGFIRFLQRAKIIYAFLFQIIMLMAAMFRVEGVVLLFLVPLVSLIFSPKKSFYARGKDCLKLFVVTFFLLLIGIILLPSLLHFGRLPDIAANLHAGQLMALYQQKMLIIRHQVLGVLARDGAFLFLLGGLIAVFIGAFVSTLGIFSTAFLLYGGYKKCIPIEKQAQKGLLIYGISSALILIGFLMHQLFLSDRYVFPLILVLLLVLVFILKHVYERPQRIFRILVGVFLVFNAVASFGHFGPSKTYVVDAGEWAVKHIPLPAKVYVNDAQLAYYANRRDIQTPWVLSQLKNYQYALVDIKHTEKKFTEQAITQAIGKPPVKVFRNKRGDEVAIFVIAP